MITSLSADFVLKVWDLLESRIHSRAGFQEESLRPKSIARLKILQ